MKVVALGGCGEVGRYATATAMKYGFVEELVIADRDGESAARVAQSLGTRATFKRIDATSSKELVELFKQADVVLNTVGPFYRFGVPILEAAIEAGCDYFDICDDWEPTLKMLELNDRAREAGITAIIGMGVSPGLTNLLAAMALTQLDSADDVITGWNLESMEDEEIAGDEGGNAAIEHWIHQCTGNIRVHRDGGLADVKPLQRLDIDYPDLGMIETWTVGHPEAVTLPLTFQELKGSRNVMILPRSVLHVLRAVTGAVDRGWIEVETGAKVIVGLGRAVVPAIQLKARLIRRFRKSGNGKVHGRNERTATTRKPQLFALATGERDGVVTSTSAAVHAVPEGGMGAATGVPLATVLPFLENGSIDRSGVLTPESVIEPDEFFSELEKNFTLRGIDDFVQIRASLPASPQRRSTTPLKR